MRRNACAALIVGVVAFALYRATLLPGLDLGDTGSFQATAGSATITPRDGYPLYFALGDLMLLATRAEPARALNQTSAIEAGLACAVLTLAAAELSGSLAAAAAAALLFAGSYTFWSQAIIAEVYALHALFVALTLLLLLRWQRQPSDRRLAAFFLVYALGFGNHLSMILLAPGYTLFLMLAAPRGWRSILSPRVVALGLACAAAGALQYAWNLRALWLAPVPPHGLADAVRTFWFDVTKTDWRDTMVMHVPASMIGDRVAMYWFDIRQQVGWPGLALGAIGLAQLAGVAWRRAALMITLYAVSVLFAFSYNVGDTHVFYIPSHLFVALMASCGIAAAARVRFPPSRARFRPIVVPAAAACLAIYAGLRIYRDYPALDRSADRRPTAALAALTAGLDDRDDILLTDLNWQLQNGLSYYAKQIRPEVAAARMPDVLPFLPALVRDNAAIGRRVALTERSRAEAVAAYGPFFSIEPDARVTPQPLADRIAPLPAGTRYVLTVLKPTREFSIDPRDLERTIGRLTGGRLAACPQGDYTVIAGLIGSPPVAGHGASMPFRLHADVGRTPVEIRMESWLAADTIRRMGFGQIIAARRHTLIVERGVSFAAFDADGRPLLTAYAAGLFAPQPRYLIRLVG